VEAAMEPHRTGSTQKATKASIFPVVETVIEGRTTMIAMRIAVMTSRAYSKVSGDGKFNAMSSHPALRVRTMCQDVKSVVTSFYRAPGCNRQAV